MSPNTADFLVNVPFLNPWTLPGAPAGVRYLNPGVPSPEGDALWFRPQDLPMAESVVKAMLVQFAQLARESKSLADVSAFGQYEDPYARSSFAVRDEILAAQSGGRKEAEALKARSRAQTELCLAWALEEAALELIGLQKKFGGQWSTFEQSLGLYDDDSLSELQLAADENVPSGDVGRKSGGENASEAAIMSEFVPSRPRVSTSILVDAILTFLPLGCGLFCADADLLADWEEYGVAFTPAMPESMARFGLTGVFRQAFAPGHLLCRSRRPDPSKPWLDGPRMVVAPGLGGE